MLLGLIGSPSQAPEVIVVAAVGPRHFPLHLAGPGQGVLNVHLLLISYLDLDVQVHLQRWYTQSARQRTPGSDPCSNFFDFFLRGSVVPLD